MTVRPLQGQAAVFKGRRRAGFRVGSLNRYYAKEDQVASVEEKAKMA